MRPQEFENKFNDNDNEKKKEKYITVKPMVSF